MEVMIGNLVKHISERYFNKNYLRCLQVFGLDINKTDYVEAHGTGTPVGDPLEAEGIAQAFTIGNKERKEPMAVGSSKSNFGHMEGAAGMVQVIKTALMLENRVFYPNINYGEPNPAIDMDGWRIRVPTEVEDFKKNKLFRIGVNTFGFGGALAHMVFEQAKQNLPVQKNKGTAGWEVGKSSKKGLKIPFTLSAKSSAALRSYCQKWLAFESNDDAMEVACWLATRRSHYANRIVIFADSGEDLREKLQMYIDKQAHEEIVEATVPPHVEEKKICFVYPGQGQQSFDMGRSLYRDEPVFRKAVDDCDEIYKRLSGKSFLHTYNLFVPLDPTKKYNPDIVNEIQVSQPAILFLQVGLHHLMLHWGVKPDALVGHSLGEVAAAYASGAVTLEEAVTVQYYRAEQQVKLDGTGSMAAFRVNAEEGEKLCSKYKDLYVACNNAHESITIAGSKPVIKEICADNPGNAKELRVKCAFHTPHMDPLHDEFICSVKGKLHNGTAHKCPWYSTVTGTRYEGQATAQYFWDNIRGRVQFLDAVRGVMQDFPNVLFLELAGAATLLSSIRSIAKGEDYTPAGMVPCGQRQKDDRVSTLRGLASLHGMSIPIDWGNVLGNCEKWMRLPHYAWQHSTFRYEAEGMRQRRLDLEDRTYRGLNGVVRLEQLPFLRDHVIGGKLAFPRSGYLEYILQTQFSEEKLPILSNICFDPSFLEMSEDVDLNGDVPERKVLKIDAEQIQNGKRINVMADDIPYCQADIFASEQSQPQRFDIEKLQARCQRAMGSDEFYERLADLGVEYTDCMRFKAVDKFYLGDGEALAQLQQARDKRERINTIILDAAFTVALSTHHNCNVLLTPATIGRVAMYIAKVPRKVPLFVFSRLTHCDSIGITSDIYILDEQGNVLVEVQQFTAKNVNGAVTPKIDLTQCVYTTEWQPIVGCLPKTTMLQDFFTESNLRQKYPEEMNAIDEAEKYSDLTKEICAAYAKHATNTVAQKDVNPKVERYAKRLRQMAERIPTKLTIDDIPKRIEQIERAVPQYHQEMIMIERMGRILSETLKDPRCALTELFTEEMMGAYFIDSLTVNIYYKALGDLVRQAVEEALKSKKIVRVLEIGGRLGGLSKYICGALKDLLEEGVVEYVFTDINVAFFHLVQEKLKGFKNVRYQQLDIEKDIKTQNFVPNAMDLVVCLDTLHCTENALEASSNMRDLLCKDGWSILMESTNNHNTPEIIFGAFDLCWIFEDEREERCWMSQSGWSGVLQKAGFSDVVAVSTPNEFYHSLIVGRKTNMSLNYVKYHKEESDEETHMEVELEEPKWVFVYANDSGLVHSITSKFGRNSAAANLNNFHEIKKTFTGYNGAVNIVYFCDDSEFNLEDTMTLLQQCANIKNPESSLWIVTHKGGMDSTPEVAATAGLVRSAMSELKNIAVYMIDLEQTGIHNQICELTDLLKEHTHTDRELCVRNNTVYVPRMIRHSASEKLESKIGGWAIEAASSIDNRLDKVDFHACEPQQLGYGEVRITVHAAAINRKDIEIANAEQRTETTKIGMECAGVIESTGPGVTTVTPSSQVIAFGDNCMASSIVVSAEQVFHKPTTLSMTEAAGIGFAYSTAYYTLINRADLKKGETVLIHSACGGVGQACVELARYVGANVICTASSSEKQAYLKGQCGIQRVSSSRSGVFFDDVMNWTAGRGVDIVCNFAGGEILERSIDSLCHGGRLCQMGSKQVFENSRVVMEALTKNVSLHSVQCDVLMKEDPITFKQIMANVTTLLEDGAVQPIPVNVTAIQDVVSTLKNAASEDAIGRHVVEIPARFSPDGMQPPTQLFTADATYIVTGSSGGIGQEFSRWMVRSGARHLALISKRGHRSWFQKSAIRDMEEQGATIYEVNVDLTKEKEVKETFRRLAQNGKPSVKGLFHLAGLNEDCTLEDLTSAKFEQQINTRATSAELLHAITKELNMNLDHFVMFSSSKSAWGNPNLAAFCSSCGVLDALAAKRRGEGLPALSVQAGWLRGAGWLEDKSRAASLEQFTKGSSLHVREFLSLLHKVILRTDLPPVVMLANEVCFLFNGCVPLNQIGSISKYQLRIVFFYIELPIQYTGCDFYQKEIHLLKCSSVYCVNVIAS